MFGRSSMGVFAKPGVCLCPQGRSPRESPAVGEPPESGMYRIFICAFPPTTSLGVWLKFHWDNGFIVSEDS